MENSKNLIIAIILCLMVVIGWSYLGQKMGWAPKPDPQQIEQARQEQEAAVAKQEAAAAEAKKMAENPLPIFTESEGRDVSIKTPLYTASIYTGGGTLRSFELNNFTTSVKPNSDKVNLIDKKTAALAPLGLLVNGQPSWSTGAWSCDVQEDAEVAAGTKKVMTLTGNVGDVRVVREITFDASTYAISERVHLRPLGTAAASVRLGYTIGADASNAQGSRYDSMRVGWDENGKLEEVTDQDKLAVGRTASGKIFWGGAMSTYFMNAVMPANPDGVTFKGVYQNLVYRVALEQAPITVMPGEETIVSVTYWLGPKDRHMINAVSPELGKCIDLGWFSLIAEGLLWILSFFHQYVGNWGIAIILLTVLIKVVFWPLTNKSYSSMEKMKQLAPRMKAIKEKYSDNKEEMNKQTMALYKAYGVNPASGCLPILIQMPVFFGLYQALLTSVELRHASFITYLPGTDMLWLADLSASDPFYITPIVMGLTMFIQQRLSPQTLEGTQQKVMMCLPLVFTFMFLAFPSGLVVYWLVNNVISIGQMRYMTKKLALKTPTKKNKNKAAA